MQDKERKGRGKHDKKLTADQAKAIRESSLPASELVKIYGITKQNISNIRLGKIWKSIDNPRGAVVE